MSHFINRCERHGTVLTQCRCPGPKTVRTSPCPGPPLCNEEKLDGETDEGHPMSYPSTPGEFAYRWNRWSPERRAEWLKQAIRSSEIASRSGLE